MLRLQVQAGLGQVQGRIPGRQRVVSKGLAATYCKMAGERKQSVWSKHKGQLGLGEK